MYNDIPWRHCDERKVILCKDAESEDEMMGVEKELATTQKSGETPTAQKGNRARW